MRSRIVPPRYAELGGTAEATAGSARFMHDFLSHSIDDPIQRHGGQAEAARRAFNALGRGEQRLLMTFLRSL
jgi:CxxC motif-containing protein (DUF1111 family)